MWFLTNDKTVNEEWKNDFSDIRNLGTMETRVLKVLTDEDIQKKYTVSSWRTGEDMKTLRHCKSSTTEEIEQNDFILSPGNM